MQFDLLRNFRLGLKKTLGRPKENRSTMMREMKETISGKQSLMPVTADLDLSESEYF